MSEPDWEMYGIDIEPGDPYEPDSQEQWVIYCALSHGDDLRAATLVDLRNVFSGSSKSYNMAELMQLIRAHHEKHHRKT